MTQLVSDSPLITKIIDGISNPAFIINRNHVVLYWNKAMEELSGLSREKILGTRDSWKAFYKDKRPTLADMLADDTDPQEINSYYTGICSRSKIIEGGMEAYTCVQDVLGNERWVRLNASLLKDDSGNIAGAIETMEDLSTQDVTADKRMEENLRYYLKQITNAQKENGSPGNCMMIRLSCCFHCPGRLIPSCETSLT